MYIYEHQTNNGVEATIIIIIIYMYIISYIQISKNKKQ